MPGSETITSKSAKAAVRRFLKFRNDEFIMVIVIVNGEWM
jgi:hypothetical protein